MTISKLFTTCVGINLSTFACSQTIGAGETVNGTIRESVEVIPATSEKGWNDHARSSINDLLESTIVKNVNVIDATAYEAIVYTLKKVGLHEDSSPTTNHFINCIYVGDTSKQVSLDIRNAPLRDVLHYICKLSGFTYEAEQNTLVFTEASTDSLPAHSELSVESNPDIEHKLDEIKVERLMFKQATPSQAVHFLRGISRENDTNAHEPNEAGINIVLASNVGTPFVNINASHLTLREALRYTCLVAKLDYRVERSAVFIGLKGDPYFAQE